MDLLFFVIGSSEIMMVLGFLIPIIIVLRVFSYFRKSLKLKQEQIDLLKKILDKKNSSV